MPKEVETSAGDIELSDIRQNDDSAIKQAKQFRKGTEGRRRTRQEKLQTVKKELGGAQRRTVDLSGGRYEGQGPGAETYSGNSVQTAK